jgi:trk system potassium uptake protein TrkA
MNIVVVGGGRTAYHLCRTFEAKGHSVTVVSEDAEECRRLARALKATVVAGDGSSPRVLAEAGGDAADVVLAVTPHDQDNLVVCQLAERQFGVPRTVALVNDPDNEEVFRRLGVRAISVTHILSTLIEQRAALEEVTNLIPVAEGKVTLTEVRLRPDSPAVGRALSEVGLPAHFLVAGLLRGEEPVIPRGSTVLQAGDRLIVTCAADAQGEGLRALTGEREG